MSFSFKDKQMLKSLRGRLRCGGRGARAAPWGTARALIWFWDFDLSRGSDEFFEIHPSRCSGWVFRRRNAYTTARMMLPVGRCVVNDMCMPDRSIEPTVSPSSKCRLASNFFASVFIAMLFGCVVTRRLS